MPSLSCWRCFSLIIAAALVLAAAGCASGQPPVPPTPTIPPGSTPTPEPGNLPAIPSEIAGHEKEWPLANHDYANTRAAVGSGINSGTVSQLTVAWTSPLKGVSEWGGGTGAPIVSDGIVYFQDMGANVYAVELETGLLRWETTYENKIFGPSGPGIGYGKIFALSRIDRYSALDLRTGEELWQWHTGVEVAAGAFQPSAFGGKVYVATQAASSGHGQVNFHSYQGRTTGVAMVLDPTTGERGWAWQAVEEGFWGNPKVNSGGGLWFPPAIDTEKGITYWGTGNPSPVPGIKGYPNGSSRPGPNLYTNSLVALKHETGELLWYNQVRPHDLFNLDFQDSPMLALATVDGKEQQLVIGSGKLGVVYAFHPDTGDILWSTPVGVHKNDDLQELPVDDSTTWVTPGAWGGVETPMANSDGIVYVLTANLPSPYNATAYEAETPEQALNRSEGGTKMENGTAEMYALDAGTGKVIWKQGIDKPAFGGVTLVNDLVFTATLDGMVYAFSTKDGSVVWQWQAPGGTNAWPAVSGDYLIWPIGLGDSPSVYALKIGGPIAEPTPERQRTPVRTPQGK